MSEKPEQASVNEKAARAFAQLAPHFMHVHDHRRQRSVQHKLMHIIFFTLCAVTAGANDLVGVDLWTRANAAWLIDLFKLEHGVPSLSTFRITYMLLNPESLSRCFAEWVKSLVENEKLKAISIDGKAQRGTALIGQPNSFVHIVSAWAAEQNLTLGQMKVDGKSNEITAIPKLLDLIDIEGTVVTIDAMGTQKEIAAKIIDKGGDYILALKSNQPTLEAEVVNFFDQALEYGDEGVEFRSFTCSEEGKGRTEVRKIYVATALDFLEGYIAEWKSLRSIICVVSERTVRHETSTERRYYISSLTSSPQEMGLLIRGHWGIENGAHWVLDVAFREDAQSARAGHIAENLSLMRRMALNYLKQEKTAKVGVVNKRLKAGYDREYLLQVLGVKFSS